MIARSAKTCLAKDRTRYRRDADREPACDLRFRWSSGCGTQLTAQMPERAFLQELFFLIGEIVMGVAGDGDLYTWQWRIQSFRGRPWIHHCIGVGELW